MQIICTMFLLWSAVAFAQCGPAGTFAGIGKSGDILCQPSMSPTFTGNVKIGTSVHDAATAEPACDATKRGHIVRVQGGVGVADTYRQCVKDSSDAYAWSAFGGGAAAETTEYDAGTCSTTVTISAANGAAQKTLLGGGCTVSFTQPASGVLRLLLKVTQGTGSHYAATWTAVKWPGGLAPTITATDAAMDFISCYLDGTNTFCSASPDFR